MGPIPEHTLLERALLQHFLPLKGVRGAAVLLGEEGRWSRAASFGEALSDRHEEKLQSLGAAEGGSVEPLPGGGWIATYRSRGAEIDFVLIVNIAPLGPTELRSLLDGIELRSGWLVVAAHRLRLRREEDLSLAAGNAAPFLLGAAQARGLDALANLWIAQLEQIYRPSLAAVVWTGAGSSRLAVVSGGGSVDGQSDDRIHLQDIATRAVEARIPLLLSAEAGGEYPSDLRLQRFGAASAWLIPVDDRREVAAVLLLFLPAPPANAPGAALADQVAALLSESLTIQQRAHPHLLRRVANWLLRGMTALFGRTLWKLKLALLLFVALLTLAALLPAERRPAFTARVEAEDRQIVSAPFDGFLAEAPFQSGDRVAAGGLLIQIDDTDIRLQLTQRRSEMAEAEAQLQTARAQRDSARVRQIETRLEQIRISISLLEGQRDRAAHRAERPMIVIGGDAWRRIGDRVRLGEPLLELASPDNFHLRAFVGEDWISALSAETTGAVVLTAFPDQPIKARLSGIGRDPVMMNGEYAFPVLLSLSAPAGLDVLDGMRGIVRLDLGRASVLDVYTRGLRRWLDRTLWRWG